MSSIKVHWSRIGDHVLHVSKVAAMRASTRPHATIAPAAHGTPESVSWGGAHLNAQGLGSCVAERMARADYPRIVLGIAVMFPLEET